MSNFRLIVNIQADQPQTSFRSHETTILGSVSLRQKTHALVLLGLLGLFIFRVTAQLIQLVNPTALLPHFDRWASGALPYGVLLAFQAMLIAGVASIIHHWLRSDVAPAKSWGIALYICGLFYFLVMALRLIIGIRFESAPQWFSYPIPALFHLVLASMVIVVAHYHLPLISRPQTTSLNS